MHRIFYSIRAKITLVLFFVVFGGVISFEIYQYDNDKNEALAELALQVSQKADRLADSLVLPLWEIDHIWVSRVIDNEITDQFIYGIIVNAEGSLFEGRERDENWQPIASMNNIQGDYITEVREIVREREVVGHVKLYVTKAFILDRLKDKAIFELLMALLLGLFGLSVLLMMFNRMVLKPIEQILKSTTAIANGDYSYDVSLLRNDEFGQLNHSINTMKCNIQQRENERDKALAATRESESRFKRLASQIPVPLAYVANTGAFEFLSDRFIETFGYNLDDIPTIEDWWALAYPDEVYRKGVMETWDIACRKAIATNQDIEPIEYNVVCKNGELRIVEISGTFLGDDLLATLIDLTDRKEADLKIQRYSQAMKQSGEAVVITNQEGVIEHINAAFTKITGYSENEVLGNTPRILKSGVQSDMFYEELWNTIVSGKVWQGKVVNRKKDGESYPAILTVSPIKDENDIITHFVGVQQNLEKIEAMEAQFHQSQKMEAVGTLVGGIAHDFNNTLAGITGNLYLAKKAAQEMPNVVARLDIVEKLSFSAAVTIQQLLAFSRKGIVEMHPLSISSFLKETIKMQQASVPENVQFELEVFVTDLQVSGDVNQLQQVLLNLINNAFDAVQAVKDPSIRISLDRYHAADDFLARNEGLKKGDYAVISVIDNGCGIKTEDKSYVFEPFFTTKEPGKGTGLGLAMGYGALKTHNGVIEVGSSSAEKGTTMHVYIPLIESGTYETGKVREDAVLDGKGETILLVDDNKTVLEIGRDVLEGLGYCILTAEDGLAAIELYSERKDEIDLLILDVVMPCLGGMEALQGIREMNPDVKAFFATGYDKLSTLGIRGQNIEEQVISKPFSVSELSQLIRKTLEQ